MEDMLLTRSEFCVESALSGRLTWLQYDLTKFVSLHGTSVDHIDPSIYCVLTARSSDPLTPLVDYLRIGPRWDVASNTFRPPYFHRNSASEFSAVLYGGDPSGESCYSAGGAIVQCSHTPHGNLAGDIMECMNDPELANQPRRILESR
jgi:homogentisate 1,2-dioxygenase